MLSDHLHILKDLSLFNYSWHETIIGALSITASIYCPAKTAERHPLQSPVPGCGCTAYTNSQSTDLYHLILSEVHLSAAVIILCTTREDKIASLYKHCLGFATDVKTWKVDCSFINHLKSGIWGHLSTRVPRDLGLTSQNSCWYYWKIPFMFNRWNLLRERSSTTSEKSNIALWILHSK